MRSRTLSFTRAWALHVCDWLWRDGVPFEENISQKYPATELRLRMALYRSTVTELKGIPSTLSDRISEAIRRAGFASHEEFAHVINLPKSTLSRVLSGKADPRLSTLCRIAEGLEVSLVSLLEDSQDAPRPKRRAGRPSSQAITLTISVPPGTQAEDWFRLAAEECKAKRPTV